jgi:hypothetical protein
MSVTYSVPPAQTNRLVDRLNDANQISNQVAGIIAQVQGTVQHGSIYELVHMKNMRVRGLKEGFSENFSRKVYLTDHIFHAVGLQLEDADIIFFNMQSIQSFEPYSVVVLSNNNVMVDNSLDKYFNIYLNNPTCVFVIWDFDNHHWFALSSMLAATSDIYVPTHADNLELLSRYNNIMAGPVSCGTIQWSREYLKENLEIILQTNRVDEPLGSHIEYPQFLLRQHNVKTINKTLPSVKLVDGSYHSRDMLDRFTEWCSHKVHWVVPVLNDSPIRAFDALITGGIPIIPRSLKYHKDIRDIWDHVLFYDYEDIQNPLPITQRAKDLFDERGTQGMLDRHRLVCYNYHVDNRVEQILKAVHDEFGVKGLSPANS